MNSHSIRFDLPARTWQRLRELREKTEAASYVQVVRDALRHYEASLVGPKTAQISVTPPARSAD